MRGLSEVERSPHLRCSDQAVVVGMLTAEVGRQPSHQWL